MALALALAAMALALASALAAALAKCLSFTFKIFYVMGKALSGELSYAWTGLVTFFVYLLTPHPNWNMNFYLTFLKTGRSLLLQGDYFSHVSL